MDRTPAELDFSDRAEDKATRFRIMLRAVLGELICTTTFLFTALGAVINLKRSYPNDVSLFPIAMSFGLAAVGNIYAFAEVSGAVRTTLAISINAAPTSAEYFSNWDSILK